VFLLFEARRYRYFNVWRARDATDLGKTACLDYLGKFHLSGLRAQRHAHLLR